LSSGELNRSRNSLRVELMAYLSFLPLVRAGQRRRKGAALPIGYVGVNRDVSKVWRFAHSVRGWASFKREAESNLLLFSWMWACCT
jgi:hypothetical protein